MKYDFAVEKQFEKFVQNTTCGTVLTDARLKVIKKYFQYCYEAGHAQGYADRIYDENEEDSDLNNSDNVSEYNDFGYDDRTGEKWMDDLSNGLNG